MAEGLVAAAVAAEEDVAEGLAAAAGAVEEVAVEVAVAVDVRDHV